MNKPILLPYKGKVTEGPSYVYCPYIPLQVVKAFEASVTMTEKIYKFPLATVRKRFNSNLRTLLELNLFKALTKKDAPFVWDGATGDWVQPENNIKIFAAGGAFRHIFDLKEAPSEDIDLFVNSEETFEKVKKYLTKKCSSNEQQNEYVHNFRFRGVKFQLIKIDLAQKPEDFLKIFDIRCTMISFDGDYLYAPRGAIQDIRRKQIITVNVRRPTSELRHIQKYIKKGYTLTEESMKKFVTDVYQKGQRGQELNVGDYDKKSDDVKADDWFAPAGSSHGILRQQPFNVSPGISVKITDYSEKEKDEDDINPYVTQMSSHGKK